MGWVTLEDGQHIYIGPGGHFLPRGPGTKPRGQITGKIQPDSGRIKTKAAVVKARLRIWEKAKAKEKQLNNIQAKAKAASAAKSHANPNVAYALDHARAKGITIEAVDGQKAVAVWKDKVKHVHASYNYVSDKIELNASHEYWKDPASYMAKTKGWFSTQSPDHPLVHEIAHKEHRDRLGYDQFQLLARGGPPDNAKLIATEVGRYAATNRAEFVAEARVGIQKGKRYSEPVMTEYRRLGGL